MKGSLLEKVVRTVAYHDLFDFPMTAQEIHRALPGGGERHSLSEVVACLDGDEAGRHLGRSGGLWFLLGRGALAAMRQERYVLAERKYRRVRRFFRLARHAPFLRAVFVCNTLGRSNAREDSDIDLFVVADPGRLWTVRLFVTGLAALLRLRPTPSVSRDRLCLSFFCDTGSLALRGHAVEDDVYLPHWLHDLYPVHDEAGIGDRLRAMNRWARQGLPGLLAQARHPRRALPSAGGRFKRLVETAVGPRAERLEALARRVQLARLPKALADGAAAGSGVVLSDRMLKLHSLDRREDIRDRYRRKLDLLKEDHVLAS